MLQGRPPYNDKDYVPNEDRAYIPRGYPKFYDEDWVGLDGEAQVRTEGRRRHITYISNEEDWVGLDGEAQVRLSELRRHLKPQTSNLKPENFDTGT